MKSKFLKIFMLVGITSMMWGCYPGGPEYYDQFDLVYTNYQKDYVFKGKGKYTMPDQIVKITGSYASGGAPEFVNATYAALITNRIKSNMAALGYTFVTTADSAQADFTILTGAIEVENYSVNYWYDYWGWYYPPGGYYGWYYPYTTVTTYTTGSIAMNMIDRKNFNANDKSSVVWIGIINGLLEGSTTDINNRINKTIDQAFTQSADVLHQ